eukprot:1014203_1
MKSPWSVSQLSKAITWQDHIAAMNKYSILNCNLIKRIKLKRAIIYRLCLSLHGHRTFAQPSCACAINTHDAIRKIKSFTNETGHIVEASLDIYKQVDIKHKNKFVINTVLKVWLDHHNARTAKHIIMIYKDIIHRNIQNINPSLLLKCCKKSIQFDPNVTISVLHHMNNTHSKTMLIHVYSNSPSGLQKAIRIFKSIPNHQQDIVSLKSMMKCHMSYNYPLDAIALYEQFDGRINPDDDARLLYLKACIKADDMDKGCAFIRPHMQHIHRHNIKFLTASINFYGICGDTQRAALLFNSISTDKKDTVCINAMMTCLIANNQSENAMLLYEQLRHSDSDDTSHLLYIRACLNTAHYTKGHRLITSLGQMQTHTIQLINASIDFYCHTDDVKSAVDIFNSIPSFKKNEITIGTLMNGYICCNLSKDAVALYDEFNGTLSLNDTLHLLYLKACINTDDYGKGKRCIDQYFVHPKQHTIEFINTVLSFHGHMNDMDSACRMFDLIPQNRKDVVSMNAMMKCYINNDRAKDAVLLYDDEMLNEKKLDDISHLLYLKACISTNDYHKGQTVIHRHLPKLQHLSIAFINCIIHFYCHYSDINAAFHVFNSVSRDKKDVVSINVMMKCLIHHKQAHDAVLLYEQTVTHDDTSHLLYIKACINSNNSDKARTLIDAQMNDIQQHSIEFITTVMDWYAQRGDIDIACRIFDSIPLSKLNAVCLNSMIHTYNEQNMAGKAMWLYEQHETLHNDISHAMYLKACTNNDHYDKAQTLVTRYIDEIDQRNIALINACIEFYGKTGDIDKASDVFNRVSDAKKDVVSICVMMHALNMVHAYDSALDVFSDYGGERNAYLYSIALNACGGSVSSTKGSDIIWDLYNDDIASDCNAQAAVIRFYAKSGQNEKALNVFDEMNANIIHNDTNGVIYCAIMDCYAKCGYIEELLALFHRINKENRITMNETMYGIVLNGCSHSGLVEEALAIFNQLKNDRPCNISQTIVNIMMDCLSRNNRLDEADNIYRLLSV